MKTVDDYLDKITPWNDRPKFRATVALTAGPFTDLQATFLSLVPAFDLDYAVGAQLDAVGVRVGCSRDIPVAIENTNFSWDIANKGWDQGSWDQGLDDGTSIVSLGDDDYRRLLRARVLSNRFDGTVSMAQQILSTFFDDPETLVFVQDDGITAYPHRFFAWDDPQAGWDVGEWSNGQVSQESNLPSVGMAITVGVSGKRPPLVFLAMLGLGLVPVKSGGVQVDYLATSVDETPLFGWDMDNEYVSGWDVGSWGIPPYDPLSPLYTPDGYGADDWATLLTVL